MSIEAVGHHLKQLREAKGLSRDQVAQLVGTSNAQILRIEQGLIDTRGSLLLRFVHVVEGSADDILRLLLGEELRTANIRHPELPLTIERTEIIDALQLLISMQNKKDVFSQWVSYGKYLLSNDP